MLICEQDAAHFEKWLVGDFIKWFSEGLQSLVENDGQLDYLAWKPIDKLLLPTEPLEEQLATLYGYLPHN